MRSHIATAHGTLTVTAVRPASRAVDLDPVVLLASDEGWHTFTAELPVKDARLLADSLLRAADEAEGK